MIHALCTYLQKDPDFNTPEYLLFELEDHVGVLFCDPDVEDLDAHCDQCRDEILAFRMPGPSKELPAYLVATVGPTKYARIKAGWKEANGLDLHKVRFHFEQTRAAS